MNRPNKKDYVVIGKNTHGHPPVKFIRTADYNADLERYCDDLEEAYRKACEHILISKKHSVLREFGYADVNDIMNLFMKG